MIGENAAVINIQFELYQTQSSPIPNIWLAKAKNKIL